MLILATDMARHSEILETFKAKVDKFDFANEDHLNSVSRIISEVALFIIYYWILHEVHDRQKDRSWKWKQKTKAAHTTRIQSNTHTLENRSTISSHVNRTGRVNDSSLLNTMSCNWLHIIYHWIVREVHKKCMKLQTSSRSKPNERHLVLAYV